MFLQDFQAWKLHTWQDYLYFFLMIFLCFAVFYFISKAIIKRRNDVSARKRVTRKLKTKNGKVYHDVTFNLGSRQIHFDHLLVDAAGIVAVRTIGWGIHVYGSAEDLTWKVEDHKTKDVRIENPIRVLEQCFEPVRKALAQGDIYGVSIEALAIFADPFAEPELYLGRDSNCISFAQLGSWLKHRKLRADGKTDKLDIKRTIEFLDQAIVTPESNK